MTPLPDAHILRLLEAEPIKWVEVPNDFPNRMRSIAGDYQGSTWLVVEHDGYDDQPAPGKPDEKVYTGMLTVPPCHMHRLKPEIAKVAFAKGDAWLKSRR